MSEQLWPLGARYLIQKNRATRRKQYRALVGGRPLHRTQPTATGAMDYRRRVEARWAALRAAAGRGEHAPAG